MDVGFCGLGGMGAAMAARLMERGHRLTVWNRTAAKMVPLVEQGAVSASTPAEVARQNQLIITCVFDDEAVKAVYAGVGGVLTGDCSGKLFIETSTVSAETIRGVAEKAEAQGAAVLECPVAGAPAMALSGNLMGFAGGAEPDFQRAQPILGELCQRVDYFGRLGSGNAVKLAVNLPLLAYFEALGEAMALARDVPVDPEKIIAALSQSPGGANVMRIAAGWITEALRSGGEAGGVMSLAAVRKDLRLMLDAARRAGATLPLTNAALQSYDNAVDDGWGERPFWTVSLYRRDKREKAADGR
jgi:3-hydroxyisobutyrate dehydrogenase